jgi:hypothetical protein
MKEEALGQSNSYKSRSIRPVQQIMKEEALGQSNSEALG